MTQADTTSKIDARLAEVFSIHFDPKWGTPYWLERAKHLPFDPCREIRTIADLPRMGLMEPKTLRSLPLEDFIPRSIGEHKARLIVSQSGGTLGRPVWTAYLEEEFREAFVEPFIVASGCVGFPSGGNWLYVGPSGPHVMSQAADAIARSSGSPPPFSVDFDSRWVRKLPAQSFAATRYLSHIVEQAVDVIGSQTITTVFTTPTVLRRLSRKMTPEQRRQVCGVHYGGTVIEPDDLRRLQCDVFPNAVHLSGYGNTLFGCCLELAVPPGRKLQYFPFGHRVVFGVVDDNTAVSDRGVAYEASGRCGRLVFSRLDRTMLLVNVLERDRVRLMDPPRNAPPGFERIGLDTPTPIAESNAPGRAAVY